MGEQHQFFLVAKVKPHDSGTARYRCIGALSAQWYHGSMAVSASRRFIRLLRVPDNARIVQEELRAIAGKYGSHGTEWPIIPARPCPYTLFLANLAVHASFTPGDRYISMSGSHTAAMHAGADIWSYGGYCTVFDVTHAEQPAYCHLTRRRMRSARQYIAWQEGRVMASVIAAGPEIEVEEPLDESERYFRALAAYMDDVPMIEWKALGQSWPRSLLHMVPKEAEGAQLEGPVFEDDDDDHATETDIPSLANLTLVPAVKRAVETGDLDGIALLLTHVDKAPRIKDTLCGISPFPDAGIPIVEELLGTSDESGAAIAVSGLQLTGAQLCRVLGDGPLDVVDLSGNAALDVDGLCDLLTHVHSIRRLVLFRTGISSAALLDLLHHRPGLFYRVTELVHPALLEWPEKAPPQWASAFSIEAFAAGLPLPGVGAISVPMLSPAPLLRNITHFMKAVMEGGSELGAGVGDAALEAVLSGGSGEDWASRSVWCTAAPMRQRDWLGTFDGKWRLAVFWTSQVTISDTLRDMGLLRGSDMASRAGRTVLAALTGDDPDRTTPKPPALFYGFLREQQRKGWLAYDKQWELLNARQFLQALREETSQPEEQQHAGILGYGTALFSYGVGLLGYGGRPRERVGERPPVPEDIQQEFLDVFDQVERKGGVMGSFRYAKMAVESAAQHGFRQALGEDSTDT